MQAKHCQDLIATWRQLAEKHRANTDLHARFVRLADQLQTIVLTDGFDSPGKMVRLTRKELRPGD